MELSIVIPCYNEGRNVYLLYDRIRKVMSSQRKGYEVLFVDDGSTDSTYKWLMKLKRQAPSTVRLVKFRKNFGQTAAFDAGFKHAKGDIIITMDSDLQNDPADIPALLKKMSQGYDVVSGWRHKRKDSFFKNSFSRLAHFMRKLLTKERIHDSGCSLKAYKRDCFDGLNLYGEMHRYIPAILGWKGYRIGEVRVRHHARKHGKTKYGAVRLFKGFMDLIVVKFWMQWSGRPMHLFGGLGAISLLLGFLSGLYLLYLKIFFKAGITDRPLLLLTVLLIIVGIQFLTFGIFGDIMIKSYYDQRPGSSYSIEKII